MNCLICPKCCELEVRDDKVYGAGCRRGEEFAFQELTIPKRVITTTIWYETMSNRRKIPVKTCEAVPISDIPIVMKELLGFVLKEKPELGQIIHVTDRISLEVTGDGH